MNLVIAALTLAVSLHAQDIPKDKQPTVQSMCPAHIMPLNLNERGEMGMGFSQAATTHHFLLRPNGGAIQVEANDPNDKESRESIQMHLHHIRQAFQSGDFEIPMFVHDTVPPGASVMKERARHIRYSIEQTPNGGRVQIQTADKKALEAIHNFLRFQITEHRTGDPLE